MSYDIVPKGSYETARQWERRSENKSIVAAVYALSEEESVRIVCTTVGGAERKAHAIYKAAQKVGVSIGIDFDKYDQSIFYVRRKEHQ